MRVIMPVCAIMSTMTLQAADDIVQERAADGEEHQDRGGQSVHGLELGETQGQPGREGEHARDQDDHDEGQRRATAFWAQHQW